MPTNQPKSEKSEGSRYLLYERQENPQLKESFTRTVLLMENETGVQDSGSLTLGFDPSFQELILHRVLIHRRGKVLERLDRSKVKIIQPEPDLDEDIFTGRQTAVLFVEDLRVGDVLEYAYTLRGANPVLNGHYAVRFVVQGNVPMDRRRLRVVCSAAKPLHLRQHLTEVAPRKAMIDECTEHVWDFTNSQGIPYEDDLPVSHDPYPYVEFSDFDDWSQVVEWALPLYAVDNTNLPPDLQDLLAKWRNGATNDEERARMALNFVQDDLRYTGIELGPDSHRPTRPFETFRLRYGDCKAKAHLLCAMLREMNIEAYPALVNTSERETVARRLPSPFAFNHVIVKLLLKGRTIWIDPTRSRQGGLLADRYLPPFGKALVVKKGAITLEDIPPCGASSLQRVTSTFLLKDYDSPASLVVRTIYYGSEADRMRAYLARTDAKEIAKDYLNFYARYYPGVQEFLPSEINDQRARNVLEVTEHYKIRDLWKLNNTTHQKEAAFYAESLEKILTDPNTRLRKMPLRIPHPLQREQEIVVCLPKDNWDLSPLDNTVDCDAFSFHYRRRISGSTVRFQYDCKTKTSVLPPEKVAGYLEKLEEMNNLLGDTLCQPDNRLSTVFAQLNWLMLVIAGLGSAATLAGGIWVWRANRPSESASAAPMSEDRHLQGLGGWLIVLGFGLCSTLVRRPISLLQNWKGFFSIAAWQAVAVPGAKSYHPLYGPLLIFEVLGNTLVIGLNILAVCLFFAKRKEFPKIYITLLVTNATVLLIDHLVSANLPSVTEASHSSSTQLVFRAILFAIIWSYYILKSRRVKETFVR